ncbi:MAG TPA: hypothetical protein DEO37_06020 [Aerococcaceae bacterium]|nr:hypothetical protein [Aerococcaceae bacterium]
MNNLQDETEKCVSFIFSISVIVILVILIIIGTLDLPMGVVFHEGSTILVILNGLRLLAEWMRRISRDRKPQLINCVFLLVLMVNLPCKIKRFNANNKNIFLKIPVN